MERKALNLAEAGQMIGVHAHTVRKLIKEGRLSVVRVGSRVLVPVAEIERFLDRTARG
jgi:excisionase family DNA binding protein